MFDVLRPYMDDAIRNAKMLEEINTGRTPSKSAPGTMVHYLIRTLKPYLWSDDNPSVGNKRLIWKTKCVSKEKLLALSAFSSRQRVCLLIYLYVCSSINQQAVFLAKRIIRHNQNDIILYLRTILVRIFFFHKHTCGQGLVFTNILWINYATSCFAISESGNNPSAVPVFCPIHIGDYLFINSASQQRPFQVSFLHFSNSYSQSPSIGVLVVY